MINFGARGLLVLLYYQAGGKEADPLRALALQLFQQWLSQYGRACDAASYIQTCRTRSGVKSQQVVVPGQYRSTTARFLLKEDTLLNFCAQCGSKVTLQIVKGEDRPRYVCLDCHTIHYENPKIVVGTIPVMGNRILLCRRAIEPHRGKWTLPAGWLENGETVTEGALRETQEETWAEIDDLHPYVLANLPFINQVYFFFRARLLSTAFHAGTESLEVKIFTADEIPWDDLAFSAVHETLRFFCDDEKKAKFPFRVLDIAPRRKRSNDIC